MSTGTSSRATTSLVLGILGFLCCQILSPVAWYLGAQERNAIRNGLSAPEGEGVATAGMVLGIIGTVLLSLGIIMTLLWMLFAGGMAFLSTLTSS
jgi:hypothetical protein